MSPLLDGLPTWARDLCIAIVPPLLGWCASDVIPALHPHTPIAILGAALLTHVVYTLTTIFTREYGAGAEPSLARAMRHVLREPPR